jgi:hypothetical protein
VSRNLIQRDKHIASLCVNPQQVLPGAKVAIKA